MGEASHRFGRYSVRRWHRPTKQHLEVIHLILKAPQLTVCEMAVAMGTAGDELTRFDMMSLLDRMENRGWLTHIVGKKRSYKITELGRAILIVGIDAGWASNPVGL